jgi:aspartate/methionine/tyrosine aminotransferase
LAVDAKAKARKAAGRPIIGFGAGEPDVPRPEACGGGSGRRVPRSGQPPLQPRWRACPSSRRPSSRRRPATLGTPSSPGQVLVTNGGKQAVYEAFRTCSIPGDEVLLPAPYWTTTRSRSAGRWGDGAVLADETSGYLLDVDQLEQSVPRGPKCSVFCSPSNPTGAVYDAEQVRRDRAWGTRTRPLGRHRRDLRAPRLRRGVAARCRCSTELAERCVVVHGVAKTYAMTGCVWLADRPRRRSPKPRPTCSRMPPPTSATVAQRAAIAALRPADKRWSSRCGSAFDSRRRRSWPGSTRFPASVPEPQGAFYAYVSVRTFLKRGLTG